MVIAAAVWGRVWQGKAVGRRCDNQAVVAVLHSRTSKEPGIMHLLRCLFFFEAKFSFHIIASHIAGVENSLGDDISRNNMLSVQQALGPNAAVNKASLPHPTVRLGHQCQTGLDLTSLETEVQWYFEHGLAEITRKTYQAGIKNFNNFCSAYNITNQLQSLLCSYITYLAKSGLAYSSIKTYLSAVRHLQISHRLAAPDLVAMPKLSLVERGIRRAKSTEQQRSRLPITQ